MGDVVCQWKMGFVETLIHLKTPSPTLLSSVHRALGGLSYSNIVPVNRYVYLIILCLSIYALSHTCCIIMYMCQPTVPLRKEILLYFLHLIELKKNAFCKAKASEKGKQ